MTIISNDDQINNLLKVYNKSIPDNVYIYAVSGATTAVINKITSLTKIIYPDIFFYHTMQEIEINDDTLYSETQRIQTDSCNCHCIYLSVNTDEYSALITLFNSVRDIFMDYRERPDIESLTLKLCNELSFSVTMRNSFNQLIAYYIASGSDYKELERCVYNEHSLPVNKLEGKKIYESIYNRILC